MNENNLPTTEKIKLTTELKVHKHGFVRLVEVMGSDNCIEDAARTSYGKDTRKTSETRGLLRFLMRHKHTTPFEMGVLRFDIKMPIFVMRQHVRHRTASMNEYSGRYSEMRDEMYVPELEYIKPQSKTNKQGRSGEFDDPGIPEAAQATIEFAVTQSYVDYKSLLASDVSRELSRMVLPVANYTQCYWQINLHNFFHYLRLRTDSHAQQEIQDFANAMYELAKPHFPISFEAWEDYTKNSRDLSRMEQDMLAEIVTGRTDFAKDYVALDRKTMFEKYKHRYGISEREWEDFYKWCDSLGERTYDLERKREANKPKLLVPLLNSIPFDS